MFILFKSPPLLWFKKSRRKTIIMVVGLRLFRCFMSVHLILTGEGIEGPNGTYKPNHGNGNADKAWGITWGFHETYVYIYMLCIYICAVCICIYMNMYI